MKSPHIHVPGIVNYDFHFEGKYDYNHHWSIIAMISTLPNNGAGSDISAIEARNKSINSTRWASIDIILNNTPLRTSNQYSCQEKFEQSFPTLHQVKHVH